MRAVIDLVTFLFQFVFQQAEIGTLPGLAGRPNREITLSVDKVHSLGNQCFALQSVIELFLNSDICLKIHPTLC